MSNKYFKLDKTILLTSYYNYIGSATAQVKYITLKNHAGLIKLYFSSVLNQYK